MTRRQEHLLKVRQVFETLSLIAKSLVKSNYKQCASDLRALASVCDQLQEEKESGVLDGPFQPMRKKEVVA